MSILENAIICFDNSNRVFRPGKLLQGHVEINFDSSKKVSAIFVEIVGKSTVNWSESDSTKSEGTSTSTSNSYTNEEKYFNYTFCVAGQGKGEAVELPAGKHVYPFRCTLPPNLPPSFEDSTKTGKIVYSVKVTLERPWKINKDLEVPFIVDTLSNCDYHPQAKRPGFLLMEKRFGLIFKSKPLKVVVQTDNTGFGPGHIISLTIEVNNYTFEIVYNISVRLRQILTFHAKTKVKTTEKTLSKIYLMTHVRFKRCRTITRALQVPDDIVVHDLSNCKIIDARYELKVELHTAGLNRNLIGTILMHPVKNS